MANNTHDWIDRFLHHLQTERRLSENTRKHYRRDLDALHAWCQNSGILDWSVLDTGHVRQYAAQCHRRGLGGRSIQRRLSALRTFFNYLLREHAVTANPGLDVRAPQSDRTLPDTVSVDDISQLLDGAAGDDLVLRDIAILELLYSSGLRLAELVSLNLGDIDHREQIVRVTGKGAKTRVLPVGRRAIAALDAWLAVRPAGPGETA
ncbi:MAG: site-specific integrase, partial [Gammaproteobacteria bacterium]|nr:site-specific integrase [Gammaproteobacteria bacterium]